MPTLLELPEAKAYLRLGAAPAEVNDLLFSLLDGAETWVAARCSTDFTVRERVDYLDGDCMGLAPTIAPLLSVSLIKDSITGEQWSADSLRVANGRVYRLDTDPRYRWPHGASRYEVTYVAGYKDGNNATTNPAPAEAVAAPSGFKVAILTLVRRMYEARGEAASSAQHASVTWDQLADSDVEALLAPLCLGKWCA